MSAVTLGEPRLLVCLAYERLRPLTLGVGMLTMAAPSGTGGTPAAITEGGGGADMRRASNRRYLDGHQRPHADQLRRAYPVDLRLAAGL